jgi:uncharacterized damage-inducible protein DinB
MIQDIQSFIVYFGGIRRRTNTFIKALPPDQMDWLPRPDEFTCGDIVRHLAATEKMYVNVIVNGSWEYEGHDRSLAQSLDEVLAYLETVHVNAMMLLSTMPDMALYDLCPTLGGPPVKAWRILMAMVEHEVHHRSQLASYLMLLGIEPPQIYGIGYEEITTLSAEAHHPTDSP